jgi:hypothetical protein
VIKASKLNTSGPLAAHISSLHEAFKECGLGPADAANSNSAGDKAHLVSVHQPNGQLANNSNNVHAGDDSNNRSESQVNHGPFGLGAVLMVAETTALAAAAPMASSAVTEEKASESLDQLLEMTIIPDVIADEPATEAAVKTSGSRKTPSACSRSSDDEIDARDVAGGGGGGGGRRRALGRNSTSRATTTGSCSSRCCSISSACCSACNQHCTNSRSAASDDSETSSDEDQHDESCSLRSGSRARRRPVRLSSVNRRSQNIQTDDCDLEEEGKALCPADLRDDIEDRQRTHPNQNLITTDTTVMSASKTTEAATTTTTTTATTSDSPSPRAPARSRSRRIVLNLDDKNRFTDEVIV